MPGGPNPKCEPATDTQKLENPSTAELGHDACEGKTFVITGKVHIFDNRDMFINYVKTQGGKVSGTVSSKTDYLVNNDLTSSSSKNQKAKELGVPIISEEQFVEQFGKP